MEQANEKETTPHLVINEMLGAGIKGLPSSCNKQASFGLLSDSWSLCC